MAGFGRSNSLSINTSGSSLFGNNASQAQSSAGLFGTSNNVAQTQQSQGNAQGPSGGLFGSSMQPAQTNSLFGGQANMNTAPSSSLGGTSNAPAAVPATTGLFGTATTQAQPQQTGAGGLFGGALGSSTQIQTQHTTPGALFNQNEAQKPSLFGATAQQGSAPSLFGGNAGQQNQPATPSLFGAAQQGPQQGGNSMLGGLFTQSKPLGQSHAGVSSNANQAIQVSGLESIKGTTRFSDLHQSIQADILKVDEEIQKKISRAHATRESLPKHVQDVTSIAPDVAYVEDYLATIEVGLDNDSANIAHVRSLVRKDADEAALSFRAIENQKLPAQFHYGNASNLTSSTSKQARPDPLADEDTTKPVDLIGYFGRRAGALGTSLDIYQQQLREIESHLGTMEAGTLEKAQQLSGSRSSAHDQRKQLVDALKAIEEAILASAKSVGKVRDEVTQRTLGHVGTALL